MSPTNFDAYQDTVLAGCRIHRKLSQGGMGAVFQATQEGTERQVALKIMLPELAEDELYRDQFVLEVKLSSSVDHPNVVSVYDGGEVEAGGLLYLTMELVTGGNLAELMSQTPRGCLDIPSGVQLGIDVAGALEAAWAEGIVHRDIKPPNILHAPSRVAGEPGRWKVTDFGLALSATQLASKSGMVCGSPSTMAPEQWLGAAMDIRADLYSLGHTLYFALAGHCPFEKTPASIKQWRLAHFSGELIPLRQRLPKIPRMIGELIDQLLSRDPIDRPDSPTLVKRRLQSLESHLHGKLGQTIAVLPPAAAQPAPPLSPSGIWPPLTDRDQELRRVQEAILEACRGLGRTLVLSGPPGVGLTRLLEEAADFANKANAQTLRVTCSADPLHAIRALLRELLQVTAEAPREELLERLQAIAGPTGIVLYRSLLDDVLLGEASSSGLERTSIAPSSLAELFAQAARGRPLVLLVDRLDLAHGPSLELVHQLAHRTSQAPLLLIVASREPMPEAACRMIAGHPSTEFVALPRLRAGSIRELASFALVKGSASLPEQVTEELVRHAQGLPAVPRMALERATRRFGPLGQTEQGAESNEVSEVGLGVLQELRSPTAEESRITATHDQEAAVRRRLALALDLRSACDYPRAIRELETAWKGADELPAPLAWRVGVELARTLRISGQDLRSGQDVARAAHSHAMLSEDAVGVVSALTESLWISALRESTAEGLRLLEELKGEQAKAIFAAVDEREDLTSRRLLATFHLALGAVFSRLGRAASEGAEAHFEAADQHHSLARGLAARAGALDLYSRALQGHGDQLLHRGQDLARAERLLKESLQTKRRLGDLPGMARAFGSLARLHTLLSQAASEDESKRTHHADLAIQAYGHDLALAEQLHDYRGIGIVQNGLGELFEERFAQTADPEDVARAEEAFLRSQRTALYTKNRLDEGYAAFYLGRFLSRTRGQHTAGAAQLKRAMRLMEHEEVGEHLLGVVREALTTAESAEG
ncbi:MAG: serine/threonine-protein kinase PknK [Planctomycetes bacterium]|nr:serine/threonine-protein kinase PknK [Planctomycetota bacterium]